MLSFDQVTIEAAHYSWLGRRSWQPLLTDISLQLAPGGDSGAGGGGAARARACCCKAL